MTHISSTRSTPIGIPSMPLILLSRRAALTACFMALAGLAATSVANAQPQGGGPAARDPSFAPIGLYDLVLDGEIDAGADILHSVVRGTILILTEELSTPIHLVPKTLTLQAFAPEYLIDKGNGTYDIKDGTPVPNQTTFKLDKGLPSFVIEGRDVRLQTRPNLLGPQDHDSLITHDRSYAVRAANFEPQAVYMEQLKNIEQDILVKVYFGSWCTVCAEMLPNILKVEEELAGSNVRFEYYGLEPGYHEEEAKRMNIAAVPIGIIYVDGKETRRATGMSWRFPSMQIIRAFDSPSPPQSQ